MKSHLISQVLLKRFCEKNKIKVFNKITHSYEYKSPKSLAYTIFLSPNIRRYEEKWGNIETRMPEVFKILDNNLLLQSDKHIILVKKFICLHYLRSFTLLEFSKKSEYTYFEQVIEDSIKKAPSKAEIILKNKNNFRKAWLENLNKQYPNFIREFFPKVEKYIMDNDLEVGVATQGTDFVLSDIPVLNIGEDGRIGVLAGIGLNQSVGFAMPFGPRHAISLIKHKKTNDYVQLTNRQVKNYNAKAISISLNNYFKKPKSYESIY